MTEKEKNIPTVDDFEELLRKQGETKLANLINQSSMKCGKKPLFKVKKSREKLELFDFKMEQLVSRKNVGVPCILYNDYGLMRGQMLIVKEMASQNVVGGLMYKMEMQLVEIRGKHIILQDSKGTSTLTGGVAEYCFSIDEIGKTIFPK